MQNAKINANDIFCIDVKMQNANLLFCKNKLPDANATKMEMQKCNNANAYDFLHLHHANANIFCILHRFLH